MRFYGLSGPSFRTSLSYGESPTDKFSYALNLSYQRGISTSESVSTSWGTRNFGEGPVDILSGFSHSMEYGPRDRYGAGVQLTFQPTGTATFHINGMFNLQESLSNYHRYRYPISTTRYTTPYQTGPMDSGTQHRIYYRAELDDRITHQYTVQAGGRHIFDQFDMEYAVGWGHGRYNRDRFRFDSETRLTYYEWIINFEDRWYPEIEIAPWGQNNTAPTKSNFLVRYLDHDWDSHVSNEFRFNIDAKIPINQSSIKVGSSGLMTFKDGIHELYAQNPLGLNHLDKFRLLNKTDWRTFGRDHESYHMPWLLDLNAARDWYEALFPDFDTSYNSWIASAEGDIYGAFEFVTAGYVMTTINIGRFRFLGGVRVEHAGNQYYGRDGTIDFEGRWLGAVDIKSQKNYTHLFPNTQFVYSIGRFTNMRLAYSRSIGRPSFSQLSPTTIRNYNARTLSRGNPNLDPMLSNNLDLLFEHYFMNVGQFTIGLYYKQMTDFVYRITERIGEEGIDGLGTHAGWDAREFRNGESAMVYGFESSWQQNLDFLPGFLGNFGTYANYSYAYSEADVDRDEPTRLIGQRPHVVNIGLDYTQGSFSAQASYQWGSPSISSYGEPRFVPEIQLIERVWFDSYRDAANDLSVTIRYRLTDNFRVWVDASNIMNYKSVSYRYHRDYYPDTATLRGRSLSFGLRYSI